MKPVSKGIIATVVLVAIYFIFELAVTCKVIQVIDGDSLIVTGGTQVRLAHIDCPEWDQPWGDQATAFVTTHALGVSVKLKRIGKDRYGRTLAEVILPGGHNLNQMLVEEGLAWHYIRYSNDKYYRQLEREAQAKRRGLWSDSNPIAPWEWRRR